MTNSDSGNSKQHQPGDRVRIKHNPKHDHHSYSVEQNRARQALGGQIGSIRERTVAGAYRVATAGTVGRGAWFEADELEPIVTDADGLPVGGPTTPPVDRSELRAQVTMSDRAAEALAVLVTELGAGYDASQAGEALRSALSTAAQEAARWHEAAQDARQEAREAKDALRAAEAERDALRAACEAVVGPAEGVSAAALAAAVKDALAVQLTAVVRTADHRCADARRIAALEARVARLETMGTGMGTEPTARARVSGA